MSSDLIVYLPIPLPPLLDRWQLAYRDRGGAGDFDRAALDRIRFGGTYTGFFPIGGSGCELYVQLTDPDFAATDPVPGVPVVRCKALFSMQGDEWPLGLLAAEALAAAGDGAVYDPQAGQYLRVGSHAQPIPSIPFGVPPAPQRSALSAAVRRDLLWTGFFALITLYLLLIPLDRLRPALCAPLYDLLGPVGSAAPSALIGAWFGWQAWQGWRRR